MRKEINIIKVVGTVLAISLVSVSCHKRVDCEQFIEGISALNKQKDFNFGCLETLNPFFEVKAGDLRKDYDCAYTDIFREYDLSTNELNKELDQIWEDANKRVADYMQWISALVSPAVWPMQIWEFYKGGTLKYARERCSNH